MVIARVDKEIKARYESEKEHSVFKDEPLEKLQEPQDYSEMLEYTVSRRDIDLYNHMHNLYYLDLAYEVLPEDVFKQDEFNNVRISYKKEIRLGDTIKCIYKEENNKHIVAIKSKDGKKLHAIIKMW